MNINEAISTKEKLLMEIDAIDILIASQKKSSDAGRAPNRIHRKVRTVARALLDLYDLLEEVPKERNELVKVAERDL